MKPHTFSPDGKWMWNGNEWIPAPPEHSPPNIAELESDKKNESDETIHDYLSSKILQTPLDSKISASPLIGTLAIFFSMFLPYISIIDIWEYSGLDMIKEMVNIFDIDLSSTGNDDNNNENENTSIFLNIALGMLLFSPAVFLVSGFVSGLTLIGNESTKSIGIAHVIYSVIFFIAVFLHKAQDPYADIIFLNIVGEGFYLGAIAGVLLIVD